MRRSRRPVGQRARERRAAGGPRAVGRPSLSSAGYETLKALIFERRAGWRCEACGKRAPLDPEHAVPSSHNGADSWGNIWAACAGPDGCHRWKEASYSGPRGRLLVEPIGDGRFVFRVARGTKHEPVVMLEWTNGRKPTVEESVRLAALR